MSVSSSSYVYSGPGVAKAIYTIIGGRLRVELPGAQVGKRLHELDVPLSEVRGFHAQRLHAGNSAGAHLVEGALGMNGALCLSYEQAGRMKRKSFTMLNVGDPSFQRFLADLAAKCPDADLRALDAAAAKKQMGFASDNLKAAIFVVLVVVMTLGYAFVRPL